MYSKTPAAQQSTGIEYLLPATTSGATASGEPRRVFKCPLGPFREAAKPKSHSLNVLNSIGAPRSTQRRFSHFTSRCTMNKLWRKASALRRCRRARAAPTSGRPRPLAVIRSKRSPPRQHSMTKDTMLGPWKTSCIATTCRCFNRKCMWISPSSVSFPNKLSTSRGFRSALLMRLTALSSGSAPPAALRCRQVQTRPKLPSPMGLSPTIA
mmetsp:Transcript_144992/g.403869  ORF Transcript_144992/g.403869 Transcript_144992/m.403869 type:complete len:210 (+) Transcript_144992:323-952(+)